MGSLIVIALCLLYFLLLAIAQVYLMVRTARDGERPRWMAEASATLACTPEAAFAFVGDPRNDVRRSPRVVAVTRDAPGGPHAGATYRETIRFGMTRRAVSCAITAYDPPRTMAIQCTLGRRLVFGGYRVAPHPDGCVVTSHVGATQTASGIMSGGLERCLTLRNCRKDLDRVRAILEGPKRA